MLHGAVLWGCLGFSPAFAFTSELRTCQGRSTDGRMGATTSKASPEALSFVKGTVASNKVVVFSKTYCPYCRDAKNTMSALLTKDQHVVLELDKRGDGAAVQDALRTVTGVRTVPQVFVGGDFIGGGSDTVYKSSTGELQQLLAAAGATLK